MSDADRLEEGKDLGHGVPGEPELPEPDQRQRQQLRDAWEAAGDILD